VARGGWVYVGGRIGNKPSTAEKAAINATCETFIAGVLRPRFLPEIRPTEFNYPVAIHGKWRGNKYRFLTRYRSDDPRSYEPEFEARASTTSAEIVSIFSGTATRVNGSACLNTCRWRKRYI
jgi:hypothetical protein